MAFGWPGPKNKFFYPEYPDLLLPTMLAVISCFIFGAWATKDTRMGIILMGPTMAGRYGR